MLTGRRALVLLGIVGIVVAIAFGVSRGRKARSGPGLLAAVPRDAWLVVHVDVAALRASPVAQPLVGALGATWPPALGEVSGACGFDPWARVREVVAAVAEAGEGDGGAGGEFGVAFSADWTKEELVACATKAIRARGRTPRTSARGSFTLIDDGEDPMRGRLAFREGGPYLVGRGPWLDAMMDAVAAGQPPPEAHRALTESLLARTKSDGPGPPPAIFATALLPRALRDRLGRETAPYLPEDAPPKTPDPGRTALLGVLGVDQVGLAVSLPGPGSTTSARAEVHCETPAACVAVKDLIERKRLGWSRNFAARLLGLGPLLDALAVEVDGSVLRVTTRAPSDDLGRAVRRVLELQGLTGAEGPARLRETP